jgi:putative peptide zinc metalloprotease protein
VISERKYKLRDDLVIRRRVFAGEVKYVVKDPLRLEYFTIDELAHSLLRLCDGERDVGEIIETAQALFPGAGIDTLTLLDFFENYRKFKFFEDPWEKNLHLIEKQRTDRGRALRKAMATPLEIHLPAWNPNRFLGRIVKPLGFLFTFKALFVYALVIITAIWVSSTHAGEFALSFGELWVIQGKTLFGIITLWLILFFTVVLHEVGHGLACRHYGGEVHKIGFLFLYFNPCLCCDVTEAYFFEDKRKKHAVTAAGGVVDLLTASVATFIWFLTSPDLFLSEVAHRVAIFNGVTGVMVNLNPLMRYDGYYMLSDHLEMPNLRGDSFRYIGNRFRALLGLPYQQELTSSRERRNFWIYGTLALLYSVFVLTLVVLFVGSWLVGKFHGVGYVLTAGLVLLLTKGYFKRLGGFMRFYLLDKAGFFRSYRMQFAGGILALIVVLFFIPIPRHVRGDFVFQPGDEVVLRARDSGVIVEVRAREGEIVLQGDAPVVLRSEEIELERGHAASVAAAAKAERSAAQVDRDQSEAAVQEARLGAGRALERYHALRESGITPVAPWDAVVLTPRLEESLGMVRVPGDTLCVLGNLSSLRAEVLLDERDIGILESSAPVEVRTGSHPGRLILGEVEVVAFEPSEGRHRSLYRVFVLVDNTDGNLRPGLTGVARFNAGKVPAYQHLTAKVARIFRIEFWI